MKRSSYGERDYAFGQRMLTLRTSIGLTQVSLARLLGISRQALGEWEGGLSYPKAEHLKHMIALGVQQHVFIVGHEEEEIRALWRAAHQKVLLDEPWLHELLSQQAPPLEGEVEQPPGADRVGVPPASGEPRVDWGEAMDVPSFYGREEELALLSRWVVEERCRVVSVLGMGGIGKSALAVTVMHRVAAQFEVVIWRSLRDTPACSALVEECLQVLAPQRLRDKPDSLEERLRLLLEQLRARRVLLVMDNLEMLLEEGEGTGRMRAGYEGYAQLLRRMGETAHQSCLLLTSREKPTELVALEGSRSPVRTLRLAGLDDHAGAQVLAEKDVVGSQHDRMHLVEVYRGNPLALKIVAQTIVELFGGEIALFLAQGEVVFGGVRALLDEQFDRLSALEQSVFSWLAILREPVSLEELLAVLSTPRTPVQVLEALDGLLRRSLIERGQRPRSFTLQSVVLEYATGRLIAEASREIEQGRLARLISYGLCLAQAKDYVRQAQERLLVVPLLGRLQSMYQGHTDLGERVLGLLDDLRSLSQTSQGYGPANLVALLRELRGDLRGLDLSRLALRGVSLQGVQMQDARLSGATLQDSVFTEPFDAIMAVAMSTSGQYWAAGSRRGEVWVWAEAGRTLHLAWQAHSANVYALAFCSDGRTLPSASHDGSVKLWDMESLDCLQTFSEQTDQVMRVAWSPDGRTLASAGIGQTIRLWDVMAGRSQAVLHGHSAAIYSLAFTPDSRTLLSGSNDGTVRVWDLERGQSLRVMGGYTAFLYDIDWSPDGTQLASGGADTLVTLWKTASATSPRILRGHSWIVQGVAWSLDGHLLASGGYDSIRLWDPATGKCLEVLRDTEEANSIFLGVAWSPDGRLLVCGSYLRGVQVWEMTTRARRWVGQTQPTYIRHVAWNRDGTRVVGGGDDGYVYVWDATDGTQLLRLAGHHGAVRSVAWSPDGRRLASAGGGREGGELFIWEAYSGERVQALAEHPGVAFAVAWSPRGEMLMSGGSDGRLRWWEVDSGHCVRVQEAHQGTVHALKVSPDGSMLASCGDDGAILLWNLHSGEPLQTLRRDRPYERLNITGIRGLSDAQKASLRALGAFEETSVGQ